jgi:hypothetical protein
MKSLRISVSDAQDAARKNLRDLRVVRELGGQDMSVVEDRESGERRFVPRRLTIMHGLPIAFELMQDPENYPV